GQAMPGDVHDIVHPAQQPDVAVLVVLGAVAGEVGAGETGPVGFLEPLLIAPDAAQHARPGLVDHQVAAATGAHRLAGVVPDLHLDAGQSALGRTGLGFGDTGQRGDHDPAGLGLPPGVHHRGAVPADHAPVPGPGLGVDRLTDTAQHAQRGQVVFCGDLLAPLHEGADRRGGGVQGGDLVLLHDLPEPALVRSVRCALVHHLGGAVEQRPVGDVGVSGHPADVGGAPVHV